jgi:WD40 repeat protein
LPKPTDTPLDGQVIQAENIGTAQSSEILLPGFTAALYWPSSSRLLAKMETSLQEVRIGPLALGGEAKLEKAGQILAISPDGMKALIQGADGGLFLKDLDDGELRVIPFQEAAYFAVFSPDGKTIALGSSGEWRITLIDVQQQSEIKQLSGFTTAAPIYSALPGPDRKMLLWYARGKLQIQDIESGKMGPELGYQDFIQGIAFHPDGKWFAVAVGNMLQVVDASRAEGVDTRDLLVAPQGQFVLSPVFSPDGSLIVAGLGPDVIVWETQNWTQVAVVAHGPDPVSLIAFSADGRILAAVDGRNVLKVWSVP